MTKADKELIDAKFQAQTALIISTQDIQLVRDEGFKKTLEEILYNVRKTNGRVTELENKEANHIIDCPQAEKIKGIEQNLLEYNFLKKYPKVIYVGIAVMVFLSIISVVNLFEK